MRAVVLSIGAELLEGFITDTNATFLAQELAGLGIELVGVRQVGDVLPRIVEELRRGWQDAELLVTTGGIGPTDDDLTREAIAALLGEDPEVDPTALAEIERFFRARGITMPEQNSKQAWLIPSAEVLPNPMGTAPGWFTRRGDRAIVTMPGVPREMKRMWAEQAVPRLLPRLGGQAFVSRTLKTIGIGESAAEKEIAAIIRRRRPVVATYAKDDGVHVRIVESGADEAEARQAVEHAETEVRAILGPYIYGDLDTSLAGAIVAPLIGRGATLAIAEVGAGGRLTSLLAEEPSAALALTGGLVTTWERLADPMERPEHVASREAADVRGRFKADYGYTVALQLTPGESPDRTRGEVALCLQGPDINWERQHTVAAPAHEVRRRAALWAAEFLWKALQGLQAAG